MILLDSTDSLLKEKSFPVDAFDADLRITCLELLDVLNSKEEGMAIAAPQVGILKRIIIIKTNNKQDTVVMVNPILMQQTSKVVMNEGCLSFPNQYRNIRRSSSIKVKWKNQFGKMNFGEFFGIEARAILHEIDHLNGILFTDLEDIT